MNQPCKNKVKYPYTIIHSFVHTFVYVYMYIVYIFTSIILFNIVSSAISMSPLDQDGNNDSKVNIKKERDSDNRTKPPQTSTMLTSCPIQQAFAELLACPHHRDVLLQLSTIIQVSF